MFLRLATGFNDCFRVGRQERPYSNLTKLFWRFYTHLPITDGYKLVKTQACLKETCSRTNFCLIGRSENTNLRGSITVWL